jgi:2-(1,2-epoxy-1,2-dihydrophenyl)acetyl-CoA isomerase
MNEFSSIRLDHGPGGVVTIELNRPEAANALDSRMAAELARVASHLQMDARVRAVILTAAGKFFCAGGDVVHMASFGDETGARVKAVADDVHRAISSFARMCAPVVVAVNGMAAGGGFSLAMCGDLVLAARSAAFTMAYSKVGLSPDGSSSYFLPRLVGLRRTQELMFTNRRLTAQEAFEWGLVTRVVDDHDLRNEASALAASLAAGPSGSHQAIKDLLAVTYSSGLETQMEQEGRLIAANANSPDGQEGITAFRDKRRPRFR